VPLNLDLARKTVFLIPNRASLLALAMLLLVLPPGVSVIDQVEARQIDAGKLQ